MRIEMNTSSRFNQQQKVKQHGAITFKQVTPEHFFIGMKEFSKNQSWGEFVVGLVNKYKSEILDEKTHLINLLNKTGKDYQKFYKNNYKELSTRKPKSTPAKFFSYINATLYGKSHKSYHPNLVTFVDPKGKYSEYFDIYMAKLDSLDSNNAQTRIIGGTIFNGFKKIELKTYQAQDTVGNQKVILTQISTRNGKVYLIHPPSKSKKPLLDEASKYFENLKQYKGKTLSKEDIDNVYEKIGSIHWTLSQCMPFVRGSATISDAICKTLFESLNIQVKPWRKGLSPDLESFITPLNEYAKKYKTFFDN